MNLRTVLLAMPLPGTIFLVYGLLRLFSIQPPTETGMSEMMSTGFFFCAAGITYFTAILAGAAHDMRQYAVYLALAGLFVLMGTDEIFMLHERVESTIGSDLPMFMFYAGVLLVSVFILRRATIPFYLTLGIFGGLGGIAVVADQLTVTGAIPIMGREIDYEQILEAAGALFAAVAFGIRSSQSLEGDC